MRTSENGLRLGLGFLAARAERALLGGIAVAALGVVAMVGCHRDTPQTAATEAASNAAANSGPDPAEANLAPANGSGAVSGSNSAQVLNQSQQAPTSQSSQEYPQQQQAAPIERQAPPDQGYSDQDAEAGYQATLTDEQASEPPPPLPVYDQPEAPDPNYIWTPGYWAYAPGGYYWVPGAWCAAPYTGALWTPGYWGFYGGRYRFHHGFWGPYIGYYGGVNYGFGYVGVGYLGGYWQGSNFNYNRNFNRVGPSIRNVYVRDVTYNNVHYNSYEVNTRIGPRVSYNGGNGGVRATPRPAELAALRQPRVAPMQSQVQAQREAAQNRQQFYAANGGRPAIAAAPRPMAAERGIAPPARTTADLVRPGMQARPGAIENRPAQPLVANRPAQPAPQAQPAQPARPMTGRPGEAGTGNPQPQAPPRSEIRRVPQGQLQPRPAQPEPARPAPQSQPQPQQRPEPQVRPQPQPTVRPQPQERPQPQTRPEPQPRPEPQARPQVRPEPQTQPRPQAPPRPAPQEEHPKPQEEHPKR